MKFGTLLKHIYKFFQLEKSILTTIKKCRYFGKKLNVDYNLSNLFKHST